MERTRFREGEEVLGDGEQGVGGGEVVGEVGLLGRMGGRGKMAHGRGGGGQDGAEQKVVGAEHGQAGLLVGGGVGGVRGARGGEEPKVPGTEKGAVRRRRHLLVFERGRADGANSSKRENNEGSSGEMTEAFVFSYFQIFSGKNWRAILSNASRINGLTAVKSYGEAAHAASISLCAMDEVPEICPSIAKLSRPGFFCSSFISHLG